MADIPPDIAVSSAQAGFTAREVGKQRDARRAGQTQLAKRQVKSLDEASATVDTADGDTAVFTDAEGSGSQGRATQEESAEQEEGDDLRSDRPGITRDDGGDLHLDLEA